MHDSTNECNDSSELSLRNLIIDFSDWWNLKEPTPLLDLRSNEEHQKRFLCHDSFPVPFRVVPFPISTMEERSFELPARNVEFSIILSEADLDRTAVQIGGFRCKHRPMFS